ncbi:MAG: hypothetical protein ACREIW_10295 [Chthoniobacterales bacterium]
MKIRAEMGKEEAFSATPRQPIEAAEAMAMWDRTVPFEAQPPVWKGDQRVRLVKLVEKHVLTKPGPPLPREKDQTFSRMSPRRAMKTIITPIAAVGVVGLAVVYSSRAPNHAADIPVASLPEIRRAIPVEPEIRKGIPVQAVDPEIDSMSAPIAFLNPGPPPALPDSARPRATAVRYIERPSVAEKRKVSRRSTQKWSSKRRLRERSIFEKMARTFIAAIEGHPRKHYRSSRRKEPPDRQRYERVAATVRTWGR